MLKILPLRVFLFFAFFAVVPMYAQEICDNALDDDADGLIDLNDPDCVCTGVVSSSPSSLIPNPSFETTNCCPTALSQMSCATTWIQASAATSDYYNTCGFVPPPNFPLPPAPIPDGNGYVGFIDANGFGYKEYVGACLSGTMNAGTNYLLKCWVGFGTPNSSFGWSVAIPFELALFGSANCANLPFGGFNSGIGCPTNAPNWIQLGTVTVNGTTGQWIEVDISFTPVIDIDAIVLGPACITSSGGGSYYYLDNLILADSMSFAAGAGVSGDSCSNDMVLNAAIVPTATYQWYRDGIAIIGATTPSYTPGLFEAGEYVCRLETGGACALSDTIFANNLPVFSLDISGDSSFCADTQTLLSASPGFASYNWSTPSGAFLTPDIQTNVPGVYYLTATDTNACEYRDTTGVNVNPLPQLGFVVQDILCFEDGSGMITANGVGGTAPYNYALVGDPLQSGNVFPNLSGATYEVVVMDDSLCRDTFSVVVNEPPALDNQLQSLTNVDCFGNASGSFDMGALGGTPPYSFSLDGGTSFQGTGQFGSLSAGNYSLMVRDANQCEINVPLQITEPAPLDVRAPVVRDVRCFGESNGSIRVGLRGGTEPYQYSLNASAPGLNPEFPNLAAGFYSVRITDAQGCTELVSGIEINQPPLLTVSATHEDLLCYEGGDGSAEAFVQGGIPPYEYAWNNGPSPSDSARAVNLEALTYTIFIRDANLCPASVDVSLSQPDQLVLTEAENREAFCDEANGQASVIATGGTGSYRYEWNSSPIQDRAVATQLLPGIYTVMVTDDNDCQSDLEVFIDEDPTPVAMFGTNPDTTTVVVSRAQFLFENLSINGVSYDWNFGDGIGESDEENPRYAYTEPGTYPVRLIVNNDHPGACPDTSIVVLEIIPDGHVYLPTAFSPNLDGINDQFQVFGEGLTDYEMIIFDRWGAEITRLQNLSETWDGTKTGIPVPEGVYTYLLDAMTNKGIHIRQGGTITLIR
ncbi:MAG: gliding motility-associated C-terminal domain-containing protein [Bacteroidota bacterium]